MAGFHRAATNLACVSESAPAAVDRGDLKSTTYELVVLAIQESCAELVDRQPQKCRDAVVPPTVRAPLEEPVQKFGLTPDAATEVARGVVR